MVQKISIRNLVTSGLGKMCQKEIPLDLSCFSSTEYFHCHNKAIELETDLLRTKNKISKFSK